LDGEINADNLKEALTEIVPQEEIDKITGNGPWIVKRGKREYLVQNDGRVEKVIDKLSKKVQIGDYVNYTPVFSTYIANGDKTGTREAINAEDVTGKYGYRSQHIDYTDYSNMDSTGNQTFRTENLRWRVFDFEDDKVALLAENPTSHNLTLYAGYGYLNGINIMNEMCNTLYGNSPNAECARALNVDDINSKVGIPGEHPYSELRSTAYKEYTVNSSNQYWPNGTKMLDCIFTSTEYYYYIKTYLNQDNELYKMLKNSTDCYLASTSDNVYCENNPDVFTNCHFHLRMLKNGYITSTVPLWHSDEWVHITSYPVFPIVELKQEVYITGVDDNGIFQISNSL